MTASETIEGRLTDAIAWDDGGIFSLAIMTDIPSDQHDLGFLHFDFQLKNGLSHNVGAPVFVASSNQEYWAAELQKITLSQQLSFQLEKGGIVTYIVLTAGSLKEVVEKALMRFPKDLLGS